MIVVTEIMREIRKGKRRLRIVIIMSNVAASVRYYVYEYDFWAVRGVNYVLAVLRRIIINKVARHFALGSIPLHYY
jgi:hypothetical protein